MTRENRQYHSLAAAVLPMLLYALFRLPVGIVLPDVQNDFDLSNWTAGVVLGSREGKCPKLGRQTAEHCPYRCANWGLPSSCGRDCDGGEALEAERRLGFGDGATSASDFHTAMNFAVVFRSPAVFFCRKNGWAISLPVSKQTATNPLSIKAAAYGFEGITVDGNDAISVYVATKKALEKVRRGEGPTLIEALT